MDVGLLMRLFELFWLLLRTEIDGYEDIHNISLRISKKY